MVTKLVGRIHAGAVNLSSSGARETGPSLVGAPSLLSGSGHVLAVLMTVVMAGLDGPVEDLPQPLELFRSRLARLAVGQRVGAGGQLRSQ